MSEQGLGLEESNTPVVPGPDGTGAEQAAQSEGDGGWSKRYTDLQAEYTRMSHETAELRRQQELYDLMISTDDPDTRRQVAERLGYQLEEEPAEEPEYDDPFEKYNERLGRIEQSLTQREQNEQDEAYAAQVRSAVDARLDTLGLDKDDQDWVLAYAINALPVTQEGLPDIEQAHSVFVARETERQRKWAKGKRSAPHIAPNGQAATEVPNLDKRQDRVDWMLQRMQENEA
jgi:hypothetical protein